MNHKVFGISFPFELILDQDVASEVFIRQLKKMSGQSTPPTPPPKPQGLLACPGCVWCGYSRQRAPGRLPPTRSWSPPDTQHTQPTYNEPPGLTVMQVQQVQPRGGPRPQAKLCGEPRQSMSSSSNLDPWTDLPAGSREESDLRRRLINRPIKRSKEHEQRGDGETANAAASLMRGNNYCSSTVLAMSSSTSAASISTVAEQQTHGAAVDQQKMIYRPSCFERLRHAMQQDQKANDDDGVLVKETAIAAIVIHEEAPDDADSKVGRGEQNTIQTHVPPTSHLDIPTMPIPPPPPFDPPQWPEIYMLQGDGAERRLLEPNTGLNALYRHVIRIEYIAEYTMHWGSSNPTTFHLGFRTGRWAGHNVQFGSRHGLTPWHGSWEYDRTMQTFFANFRYNYPEKEDLKWVKLHRDGPITFTGVDQKRRKIQMKLMTIRRLYTPSYCWRTESL